MDVDLSYSESRFVMEYFKDGCTGYKVLPADSKNSAENLIRDALSDGVVSLEDICVKAGPENVSEKLDSIFIRSGSEPYMGTVPSDFSFTDTINSRLYIHNGLDCGVIIDVHDKDGNTYDLYPEGNFPGLFYVDRYPFSSSSNDRFNYIMLDGEKVNALVPGLAGPGHFDETESVKDGIVQNTELREMKAVNEAFVELVPWESGIVKIERKPFTDSYKNLVLSDPGMFLIGTISSDTEGQIMDMPVGERLDKYGSASVDYIMTKQVVERFHDYLKENFDSLSDVLHVSECVENLNSIAKEIEGVRCERLVSDGMVTEIQQNNVQKVNTKDNSRS